MDGADGKGSSMSNRASESPAALRILLVIFVFRKTWMFDLGMAAPSGVGTPPVQLRIMSPTSSVTPSTLVMVGTLAGVHNIAVAGVAGFWAYAMA